MRHSTAFITVPVLALVLCGVIDSGHARAEGPFGLFGGCGSGCCDDRWCDRDDCDSSGCDNGCCDGRGCDGRGCDGPCGDGCSYAYGTLFGGWNLLDDYSGLQLMPPTLQGTFSDGWTIGGSIGRRIKGAFRVEFELAFRSNTSDQWISGATVGDWSGHLFTYSGMGNVYYDFSRHRVAGITPYVGTGIGLAIFDGDFDTAMTTIEIDGAAFAYQFIVGGSKSIHRNVDLFAEYRYFATTDLDVYNVGTATVIDTYDPAADNIFFGLRIRR